MKKESKFLTLQVINAVVSLNAKVELPLQYHCYWYVTSVYRHSLCLLLVLNEVQAK